LGLKYFALKDSVIIREASFNDVDTLLEFEQGVVETERPFDPTLKPHPNHYYDIKKMIADPFTFLVVAECDGKIIGSGYARIENSKQYLKYAQHAYLGFMYVVPEWRGKNINQAIMDHLEKWAAKKGIVELRLDVYVENEAAIKAYQKAGFNKLMLQMRKPVNKSLLK